MTLVRPSGMRAAGLLVLFAVSALAIAAPAAAHDGTGGDSSDYRTTITGYSGDSTGVSLRVIQLGDRVELTRDGAAVVFVLGYEGEQYLRLDADGVWENRNSPAHYVNADRFAATRPPDDVNAESAPDWLHVASGDTARWHDHRAHWMSTTPLAAVSADPDVSRVVHRDRIDLVIDGRSVGADVEIRWLPRPERLYWLIAASALGALVTAALVLQPSARRLMRIIAISSAIASMLGQGQARAQIMIGGIIVAVAVLGAIARKPLVSTVAALAAGLLAALRLEVFEHELLAGWIPGAWQRLVIVAALGTGLGIAAAALVTALSPEPTDVR